MLKTRSPLYLALGRRYTGFMWLKKSRVGALAAAMRGRLLESELVETDAPGEVERDLASVLEQYLRDEQEVTERARDMAASRGLSGGEHARVRQELAARRGITLGPEGIDYLLEQLVEMLMMSSSVEEVFGEDHQLKRALRQPLRDEVAAQAAEESMIRDRMKHVSEGGTQWEVEYQRIREEVSRRRGR